MAKSNRLKDLTKKAPSSFDEIDSIVDVLRDSPDLAAAITGAALAETGLERLLLVKMRTLGKEEKERLFGVRGPLGSFDAKIQVACAFGLVTAPLAEELHTVRNVRNVFAHSRYPLTFEDPTLADAVLAMKMGTAIRGTGLGPKMALTNKEWFVFTIRLLLILMNHFESNNGLADETLSYALGLPESSSVTKT